MPASVGRTRRLVLPVHYPIGIRGHEGRRESSMTWFRRRPFPRGSSSFARRSADGGCPHLIPDGVGGGFRVTSCESATAFRIRATQSPAKVFMKRLLSCD